eukprot:gnl/TRDRNA2_/TRDRNA2_198212_c0_seq1.p1 gnl/TRDRNA2_/TRDRNA2_198212_c0~~gnl/TRDRNA2_/TRDRNA2_198212_c0_seq1.p1  ORF type:complete len:276 (-),score=30.04 gnl/TRDRNA2_/TRDRNA2_198212_c0_seq1:332-1159(-)
MRIIPMCLLPFVVPACVVSVILAVLLGTTKVLYSATSVTMAVAAYSFFYRHPEDGDRVLMSRSSVVLLISGALYAALTQMDFPKEHTTYVAFPDVVVHYAQDLITSPMIVMNLGRLAGRSATQMAPTALYSVFATCAAIAAATVTDPYQQMALMSLNVLLLTTAAVDITHTVPVCAAMVSTVNKFRCEVSMDLLVVSGIMYPVIQSLGLVGLVGVRTQLHWFALLDLLSKAGVCHIMLKSQQALRNTAYHFSRGNHQGALVRFPGVLDSLAFLSP